MRVVVLVLGLLVGGSGAFAATTTGTILTNVLTATFSGGGISQYMPTYAATATVLVQNPLIALTKLATPTLQTSGGTVTFRVWVQNLSPTASAFDVMLTDRLPDNMEYLTTAVPWNWLSAGGTGTWTRSNSGAYAGPYVGGEPALYQASPWYLRWNLSWLGPNASGFVEFKARIL